MKKHILSILLLIFFLSGIQAADRKPFNYYFSHISSEEGLSESQVKVILQDSYGFMWFGPKTDSIVTMVPRYALSTATII